MFASVFLLAAAAVSAPAGTNNVTITAQHADYDRKQGVIFFEGQVVAADAEFNLHADKLYIFLSGTNELRRIVALGNVAITNENRSGVCARSQYLASEQRVVMFGEKDIPARLIDNGGRHSEVAGSKITFWINSEQMEVEQPVVTVENDGENRSLLPLPSPGSDVP